MNISGTTMHITDLTIDGESIKNLKSKLSRIYINNAGAHNSLYRGKNLGTSITAAQIAAIQNGSFDDIYPGDYWVFSIDDSSVKAMVMGCNLYYELTSVRLRKNHIVLWCQFTKNYNINDTATTEGGFAGSKMYTVTFPYLLSELEKVIPAANILQVSDRLVDSFGIIGQIEHYEFTNMKLFLPALFNVSGYSNPDLYDMYWYVNTVHWPAALLNPNSVNQWAGYWLDNDAGPSNWRFRALQTTTIANYMAPNASNLELGLCWPFCLVG